MSQHRLQKPVSPNSHVMHMRFTVNHRDSHAFTCDSQKGREGKGKERIIKRATLSKITSTSANRSSGEGGWFLERDDLEETPVVLSGEVRL